MIAEKYLNRTSTIDAVKGIGKLPDDSIDVVVTSPPYWGQRSSLGIGVEADPRDYLDSIIELFEKLLPKLKTDGIVWLNIGDSYNTPINWRLEDSAYSTLGNKKNGHNGENSAYTKKRVNRKAFIDKETGWLKQANLLGLPMRLVLSLVDSGYFYRGEVIWTKPHAMPEGRCRRPHRTHEPIYLLTKSAQHSFSNSRVKSVWEIKIDRTNESKHCSRFPVELPLRCIKAYGKTGKDVVIFDPFSGSGTTSVAAKALGCTFVGFEIDPARTKAANARYKKSNTR